MSKAMMRRSQLELCLDFLSRSEGRKSKGALILACRDLIEKVGISRNMWVGENGIDWEEDEAAVYEWCMGQLADVIDDEAWGIMNESLAVCREHLEIWRTRRSFHPELN